jgi:hypothetical protein
MAICEIVVRGFLFKYRIPEEIGEKIVNLCFKKGKREKIQRNLLDD